MKDRIQQIMHQDGLTSIEFAKKIEISSSSLSHIFNGRNNPSLDVIMHIHKAYPNISLNWLLYGEGKIEDCSSITHNVISTENNKEADLFANNLQNTHENTHNGPATPEFRIEIASETQKSDVNTTDKQEVIYQNQPQPKISEIRIFYDNGTFEVFKPERSK